MDPRVQFEFRSKSQNRFQNNIKPRYRSNKIPKFSNKSINNQVNQGGSHLNDDRHEPDGSYEHEKSYNFEFDTGNDVFRDEFKRMFKSVQCSNCGRSGHEYKECTDAIISIGIILLKFDYSKIRELLSSLITSPDDKIDIVNSGIKIESSLDISLFSKLCENIKFLIIRRKHTLGYIEFIRGRYKPDNVDGIVFLFQQMTKEEIAKIGSKGIGELWDDFWIDPQKKLLYDKEFQKTKQKFEKLRGGDGTELTLDFYVKHVVPTWDQAEWGFPKGRRNKLESNKECAHREFEEESGFTKDDYILLEGIRPFVEEFIGTNGVRYKHIYYVGYASSDKVPSINKDNIHQATEIGDIGYYTYNELMDMIRPYHVERKRIVIKLYMYLLEKIISELKISMGGDPDENYSDSVDPTNQNIRPQGIQPKGTPPIDIQSEGTPPIDIQSEDTRSKGTHPKGTPNISPNIGDHKVTKKAIKGKKNKKNKKNNEQTINN